MKTQKAICPVCITLKYDDFERLCRACSEEAVKLKTLYTRILHDRPALRPYGMHAVFARMYERVKELEAHQ